MDEPTIKRILVPVDFLDMTSEVVEYAAYLAGRFEARLTLLHVVHVPPLSEASTWLDPVISPSIEQDVRAQMKKTATEKLGELAGKCRERGLEADPAIKEGPPVEEILAQAEAIGTDLIVMGTQGRTGLSHILVGSVAERVVRRANCNVLCIKPGPEHQEQ